MKIYKEKCQEGGIISAIWIVRAVLYNEMNTHVQNKKATSQPCRFDMR